MSKYDRLQDEHQSLLERKDTEANSPAFLQAVQDYIQAVKTTAAWVDDPRDRSQLRANLRYWASYVFENTGTYPDTTLFPAGSVGMLEGAGPEESGAEENSGEVVKGLDVDNPPPPPTKPPFYRRKIFWILVAGAAGLLLLCYGGLQILPKLLPQVTTPPTMTPKPYETSTPTQYVEVLPTTQTPTSIVPPQTPEPPSGEIEALLSTQIVLLNQVLPAMETPVPTPTEYSISSGEVEGQFVWMQAEVTAEPHPSGCGARTLRMFIIPTEGMEKFAGASALVTVSTAGKGEVLYSGSVGLNGKELSVRLPTEGADLLLVQVDATGFLFDTVILQFAADCSQNLTTLAYQTQADAKQIDQVFSAMAFDQSILSLDWRLETWGPSALWDGWAASLYLAASGGDGSYIYWGEGSLDANADAPLPGARLVVTQRGCERAFLRVGVTSAGAQLTRPISLLSPYCLTGENTLRP